MEPLKGETAPGYEEAYANGRLRSLRVLIGFFVVVIISGAVLTGSRLLRISRTQAWIDASYPACRKGYALGAHERGGVKHEQVDLLLWSGKADDNCLANELCNDLWTFQTSPSRANGTSGWKQVARQSATRPEPRWKTVTVQDANQDFYIFGGDPMRPDGSFIDDVWKLTIATMQWTRLQPTCNDKPSAPRAASCAALLRRAHAAVILGDTMFMHGGMNPSDALLNDVWSLNLVSLEWRLRHLGNKTEERLGFAPTARKGHTLVPAERLFSTHSGKFEQAVVLFAGRIDVAHYFNDVWAFFPRLDRWEQLDNGLHGGAAPHLRDHHAAATYGNAMYTYGGWYQYWTAYDDIWRYDFDERNWTQLQPVGAKPLGRFLISFAPVGSRLYLVGGELGSDEPGSKANSYLNDVWAFDVATSEWVQLAQSRCPRDHSAEPRPARVHNEVDRK